MAKENKPQHQWTDKQKINALTKLIIEHNNELPQEFLLFVDSPDGPVNYEAELEIADAEIKSLFDRQKDLLEANAELENDKTATNREIAKLKRERDDLQAAYDLMLTEENPSEE